MRAPLVSVIVPVRHAARTIEACLRSLVAQEYPEDRREVLVVDNGATDGTLAVVRTYPVILLTEPAVGAYAARNRAAGVARGEILAFTDADCVADRRWLLRLVAGFEDGGVGCVAGEVSSPSPEGPVEEFARRRNLMSQANTLRHPFRPYAITANCAYRAEAFRRLGGFRPEMQSGGDADLAWRMQLELGLRIAFRPEAVVWHHHRTSLRELMAQSRKYALGAVDLARRFDLPPPPLGRRILGLGRAALRALVAVPLTAIRRGGRIADADVLAPLCEVTWRAGEVAGLLRGYRDPGANRR